MKARRLILAFMALAVFGCMQTATFTEFVSEEGGFSVSMPGTPTEETNTSSSAAGDIDMHMFSLRSGGNAYLVGYSDYPPDLLEGIEPDDLLDFARDGAVSGGTLVSEAPITLNGHPGRDLTVETSEEGMKIYIRMYLVGNRLYQVIVSTRDGDLTEDMSDFLDSFKLRES